jgi:squalene monooxygenase
MESDYLFGAIVASLLAVIFLFRSRAKKARTANKAVGAPLASILEAEAAEIGSSGEGADIIVVGAGVAGSALAYTLAKVRYFLFVLP